MNESYCESLVELLGVLKYTDKKLVNKIPKELMQFFKENASTIYKPKLDYSKKLEDIGLRDQTKAMIVMLHRNYWCTPEKRNEYDKILKENEIKYQEQLKEKYSVDVFKKKEETEKSEINVQDNVMQMVEYKQPLFTRLLNKIKSIFKRK